MMRKIIISLFIVAVWCLGFPTHTAATATSIDGIHLGMRFTDIRAAKPNIKWTMTPIKFYGRRGFARVLAGQNAAKINGQAYDMLAVRGPKIEMAALHFVRPAVKSDKNSCQNSVADFVATVVDVAQLDIGKMQGTPPPKLIEEPRIWGIVDKFVYGINGYGVPERNVQEYYDFAAEKGPAGTTIRPDWIDFKTHISWHVFNWDQETLVSIFVEFNPDVQNGDIGLCRVGFSLQHGGSETIYPSPTPIQLIKAQRADLLDAGNLSERYQILTRRSKSLTPLLENGIYTCSISLADTKIEYCSQQDPPATKTGQIIDFAPSFLKTYKINMPKIDEGDFAARTANVEFTFNDQDVVPAFKWGDALAQKLPAGFILKGRPQISSDDFPTPALREKVEATVYFDCVILNDLTVYCGRARVEPDAAKPLYEGFMTSLLPRRFKNLRAEPKPGQDISTANRYFHYVAHFRLPPEARKSEK
jgi:hypothetical protein